MPTYEYECTHCGHNFEAFQKMSDKALGVCPKCSSKLRRVIGGGSGIIFKGSGFYATDYKKSPAGEVKKSSEATCPNAHKGCGGCSHANP